MNKTIFKIMFLLSVITVITASCDKNEVSDPTKADGKYTLIMDGKTIASGTTLEVGWLETAATMSEGDNFSIIVASIPGETGKTYSFDNSSSSGTVTIMGKNILLTNGSDEMYFSQSGSVTRVSKTKVSFEGKCSAMMSTEIHTFSGTMESDVFKVVYEKL